MSLSAHAVRTHLAGLVDAVDTAHVHGLAIPPKVADALATIGALAAAWEFNADGRPAPEHVKALLGLPAPEEVTP
jgi:hypothetical protein